MCKQMFLQLSDLHFGTPESDTVDSLRERIKVSIIQQLVNHNMKFSGLFITGDIIYGKTNNKRKAYREAASYIKTICAVMGIQRNQVYIVPGNHDIDLSDNTRLDSIDKTRKEYKWKDGGIAPAEKKNLRPSNEFLDFYKIVTQKDYHNKQAIRYKNNGFVDILCLDSSITCTTSQKDYGQLILGLNDLNAALDKRHRRNKPMIVLAHHDPNWFLPREKRALLNRLIDNAAFIYCCGHIHTADAFTTGNLRKDNALSICIAPTMMDDGEQTDMGYNIICIDTDSKDIKAESFIYGKNETFENHILLDNGNFNNQDGDFHPLLSRTGIRINSCELFFARDKKRLTMEALASGTDISRITIQNYERLNEAFCINSLDIYPKCNEDHIITLSKALSIDINKLVANTDYYKYERKKMEQYKSQKGLAKFPFPCAKTKIVVFDFDGTLTDKDFQKSSWERMWEECGYSVADCDELAKQYFSGQFNHQEWCNKTAERFIDKEFSLDTLDRVAKKTKLIKDCDNLFSYLNKKGVKLFIVSGSVDKLIHMVLGDKLYSTLERIQANKMDFDNNGKLEKITSTRYDFEGKARYINGFLKEGYTPNQIVYFGNSNNDEYVHSTGIKTICVNPAQTDPHSTDIWNDSIHTQSANDLLKFIDL